MHALSSLTHGHVSSPSPTVSQVLRAAACVAGKTGAALVISPPYMPHLASTDMKNWFETVVQIIEEEAQGAAAGGGRNEQQEGGRRQQMQSEM